MAAKKKTEKPKRPVAKEVKETKPQKGMSLHKRLAHIQQNLKAPKNQFNKFGNYNYRNCEDILEALKPLLGNCIIQISDEIVNIGDRYYVKATVRITDENGGSGIQNVAYAREADEKKGMDASQVTGATSSYARKYALNGLFAIDDTKDADTQDNRPATTQTQPTATGGEKKVYSNTASEAQQKMIFALGKEAGYEGEKVKDIVKRKFGLESFADLNKAQASSAIEGLQRLIEKQKSEVSEEEDFNLDEIDQGIREMEAEETIAGGDVL